MLKYDKIIVDSFNIYHRVAACLGKLDKEKIKSLHKNNTVLTCYVSLIEKLLASTYGEVCVVFDPLLSTGDKSKRAVLRETYKANRPKDKIETAFKQETLSRLYEALILSNQSRLKVYYDTEYEADDFVAKLTEKGNCLMMTSDYDWAKYLEDGRVDMLKKGLTIEDENIYTATDFENSKDHPFHPNIPSIIFWKAMYGDTSDDIEGAFTDPKVKVLREADAEMKAILKLIGRENPPLQELKYEFFNGAGRFAKLYQYLQLSSTEKSYERILNTADINFQLVESLLPRSSDIDVEKFRIEIDLHIAKPVTQKFTLGRKK